MADRDQGESHQGAAKVKNRGGRPRKYATTQDAQAQEVKRQKEKRRLDKQARDLKTQSTITEAIQIIQYQPTSAKPGRNLPTQSAKHDRESQSWPPKPSQPLLPLLQEIAQDVKSNSHNPCPAELVSTTNPALAAQTLSTDPPRAEGPPIAADALEVATILSSMPFYISLDRVVPRYPYLIRTDNL